MTIAGVISSKVFTKEARLLRPGDFERVRKKGKKRVTKSFVVYTCPSDLDWPRLGLAVSARVGGAVKRNRIKRLLREFFRLASSTLSPPVDIVVSARKGLTVKDLSSVTEELSFLRTAKGAGG